MPLLKNKKALILIILFVLTVVSLIYIYSLVRKSRTSPPTSSTNREYSFKYLTPGEAGEKETVSVLGTPKKDETNGKNKTLFFDSNSAARDNQLIFKDNKLLVAKEMTTIEDAKKSFSFTDKYGLAPNVLYGPDAGAGFFLYIYPDRGLAYIGNPYYEFVTEIWYFAPTTFEIFSKEIALEYKKERPELGQ